jgi:hypothetical protein
MAYPHRIAENKGIFEQRKSWKPESARLGSKKSKKIISLPHSNIKETLKIGYANGIIR